jgi:hypothetical protein
MVKEKLRMKNEEFGDVAEVFQTSEALNNALRAILSAIPKKT